jgi:hypothetical protein
MTSALSWAACGGRTWAQVEPPNDLSNFSSARKTLFTRYGWAASEIAQRTGAPFQEHYRPLAAWGFAPA